MTTATLVGFDVPALVAAAGSQAVGQQKAKYCADVATQLGANPIFEIVVGGVVKYRSTATGGTVLASSSAGVVIPAQFVEPPSVNLADALTGSNCFVFIRHATNTAIYVSVPVKLGGGVGFLSASLALDGSRLVRTSAFRLTAPATLDVTGGTTGTVTYAKQSLIDDMTLANENEWGIAQAPNTQRGSVVYAQITTAINRVNNDSGYPNRYISDTTLAVPSGGTVPCIDTSVVRLLGWIVAGRGSGSTTRSLNSRLQLRGYKIFARMNDSTWQTLATVDNSVFDALWHTDFAFSGGEFQLPVEQGGAIYQARQESVNNGGGQSLGSIGSGNWGTVFNPNRGVNIIKFEDFALSTYPISYENTKKHWVDNIRGVVVVCEARLIIHDPSQADDRANANIMIWPGANWYVDGNYISDGHGVSRLKLVPANGSWRTFSFSSVPTATLNSSPPPGWS